MDALCVNHWIGNEEVVANDYREDRDPGMFDVVVAHAACGSKEAFDTAAEVAHEAQPAWRNLGVRGRVDALSHAFELSPAKIAELAELLVREAGHDLPLATADVMTPPGALGYYAPIAEEYLKTQVIEDEVACTCLDKIPKGVALVVSPWNMPCGLTASKMVPALLMGNTCVVKPPSDAPAALTFLLSEYAKALPAGVINVANGSGAELEDAIVDNERIRVIGFTGGTVGGKRLYAGCAKTMKRAVLELSGNDPAIVLDDVDIDAAVPKLVRSAFMRSGQVCFAVKRIYVPNSMIDRFVDRLSVEVGKLKCGYGLDPQTTLGPVMNARQYERILGLLEDAREAGAEVRELGSKSTPELWESGYYIMPHVVKAPCHDLALVKQEQFGPVLPVVGYDSIDEAVRYANDSNLGLCSSVWTGDSNRGVAVAEIIEAGQTLVNGHRLEDLGMGVPFGGVKDSGIGRDYAGDASLAEYIDYHPIRVLK